MILNYPEIRKKQQYFLSFRHGFAALPTSLIRGRLGFLLWPPLTRGLAAKLTGGETPVSLSRSAGKMMQRNLSLRPFCPPPSTEGGLKVFRQ